MADDLFVTVKFVCQRVHVYKDVMSTSYVLIYTLIFHVEV